MVSLKEIKDANLKALSDIPLDKPVAVFIGGTSGIGEHTAYKFAEYTKNPTVYIVGRSESAGTSILSKLKEINDNPEARYYFLKHDISLIKECDKVVKEVSNNEKKVNLLVLSTGFLNLNGRVETAEGLDVKMSVNYYGRWRIVSGLMPLLSAAAQSDPNQARVLSVLSPGAEGPLYEDDLDLKKDFSLRREYRHVVEFNSLAVTRFAKLYPNVSFAHTYPGAVNTKIVRDLPWWIRWPANLLLANDWLITSAADSGDKHFYMGYTWPKCATGAHIVGANFNDLKEKADRNGYLSERLQNVAWDHTEQMFKDAVSANAAD